MENKVYDVDVYDVDEYDEYDDERYVDDIDFVYDEFEDDTIYKKALIDYEVKQYENEKYVNEQLINDNWYHILLYSEDQNLNHICTLNRTTNKICQRKNIWIDKLNLKNLPTHFLDDKPSYTNWLNEYQKIVTADIKTKNLLKKINIERQKFNNQYARNIFSIDLPRKMSELYNILLPYMIEKLNKMMIDTIISIYIDVIQKNLVFNNYNRDGYIFDILPLSDNQLYTIIFNLYYNNYNVKLCHH